jgi:hypothetical protein
MRTALLRGCACAVAALAATGCGRSEGTRATAPATPSTTAPTTPGQAAPAPTTPGQTAPAPTAPGQTAPAPTTPGQTAPSPGPPPGRAGLLVIGDSLSVGTAPILPGIMPGWRVATDGVGGRPLAAGMFSLAETQLPTDGSIIVGFSLFTNDDPTHTADLQSAVRTSLDRVGPKGCVIWATIVRPPINGVPYDAANALLRRMARSEKRMRLVPWDKVIAAQPALMGPDGIHPTPQGYQVRAQMYADAARSC